MRVVVVKDGTVPILVAEVIATDLGPEHEAYSGIGDIEHDYIEMFEVDDDPEALDVTWADSEGFSVSGTMTREWFKYRQADEDGGPIRVVANGHFVQSDIAHGEDEHWYSHLFELRKENR